MKMTTRWKLTRPALALAAVLAATTTASAATNTIYDVDTSDFGRADVTATAPFGALPVDTSITGHTAFNQLLATLSSAQETELTQRCAVILDYPGTYSADAIQFCGGYYFAMGITPAVDGSEPNDAGSPYHDAAGNVTNDAYYDL
jgi:hypothetical protein